MQFANEHTETVKEASAIKKVVFKGSWAERKITEKGWTRESEQSDAPAIVHYKDGKVQKHKVGSGKKVEYWNGQYFFPDEGEIAQSE